jgi:hypothetical protein
MEREIKMVRSGSRLIRGSVEASILLNLTNLLPGDPLVNCEPDLTINFLIKCSSQYSDPSVPCSPQLAVLEPEPVLKNNDHLAVLEPQMTLASLARASVLGGVHSARVRQEVCSKKIKDAQSSIGQLSFFSFFRRQH